MKLNIKASSETGKIKSVSGNKFIEINVNVGNTHIGRIRLEDDGVNPFRAYYYPITANTGRGGRILLHEESKKQQGGTDCGTCNNTGTKPDGSKCPFSHI